MKVLRLRAGLSCALLLGGLAGVAGASSIDRPVVVVPITGTVDDGMAHLVERSVDEANRSNARAILLTVNSPGGLVSSAFRIRDALFSAQEPVDAYVAQRAYSAAALITLAMLTMYILISGLSVPAVRSYLMIGVVLAAVLLDRTALSLRSIGWAALVLMAVYPDAVVGASFEMSFMAVLALIAIAEEVQLRAGWRAPDGGIQIMPVVGMFLAGAVVTDIAAGGSTLRDYARFGLKP